jgi:Zn-finger nucleic acid-binding protein
MGSRAISYANTITVLDEYEREQKKTINSVGTEITVEIKQCPSCAGVVAAEPEKVPDVVKRFIARNKPFEEPLPAALRPKLIAVAAYNAMGRIEHKSRRAKVECEGTIPTIKHFVETNPKYVF